MHTFPKSIERLIGQLTQLPGVGPKTASRLVFYLLRDDRVVLSEFAESIANLKADLVTCETCHNIADENPCRICADVARDATILCLVEEPLDVLALERSGYRGQYHVLGGRISPMDGIGPGQLTIDDLILRLKAHSEIGEVVIATNPNVEGEATASYIVRILRDLPVKLTRIARGLPMGGDLEYADELTLHRAMEGRSALSQEAA
jgi:recombination protein RecR